MSKTKLLSIFVAALVALNIILIVVFVIKKPPHPPNAPIHHDIGGAPKNIIIKKLHFDKKQIASYEKLIEQHRSNINSIDGELKVVKQELYILLSKEDQTGKDSLITKVMVFQKEIESTHFNHFLDIKKLCTKEQLKDYNELTHELARLFAPHPSSKK